MLITVQSGFKTIQSSNFIAVNVLGQGVRLILFAILGGVLIVLGILSLVFSRRVGAGLIEAKIIPGDKRASVVSAVVLGLGEILLGVFFIISVILGTFR